MIPITKETKSERITIHLTPSMKSLIRERANACNMDMSNYLLACVVTTDINVIGDEASFKQFAYEVNKLGGNINQIRLLAQLGKINTVSFDECNDTLLEIKKKISSLIRKKNKWRSSSFSKELM